MMRSQWTRGRRRLALLCVGASLLAAWPAAGRSASPAPRVAVHGSSSRKSAAAARPPSGRPGAAPARRSVPLLAPVRTPVLTEPAAAAAAVVGTDPGAGAATGVGAGASTPAPALGGEVLGSSGPAPAPVLARRPGNGTQSPTLTAVAAQALFDAAATAFYDDDWVSAAAGLYVYLQGAPRDAADLGWAQYFLAESFYQLGLTYSAQVYFYLVAKVRSVPEVVETALGRLMALADAGPVDEALLYEDLLVGSDWGALPEPQASWVAYQQGLVQLRADARVWAERQFQRIDPPSPWRPEADYARAVQAVRAGQDGRAIELLNAVLAAPAARPATRAAATLSLARLRGEGGDWAAALLAYRRLPTHDLSHAAGLLLSERAWATYAVGDRAGALGLLHALDAPAFSDAFYPDLYLLRAQIYQELCYPLAAKATARAFSRRYGRSLEHIRARRPLQQSERIRRITLLEGELGQRTQLLRQLHGEGQQLRRWSVAWTEPGLLAHLQEVYAQGMAQHERIWNERYAEQADRVALRLLDTEQQLQLLIYEVDLALNRPSERAVGAVLAPPPPLPDAETHDLYRFDGEYWNEELSLYRVDIASRCNRAAEGQP